VNVDDDVLMQFAAIGTRQSGFNHDIASKMQGIMMALDELTELISGESGEIERLQNEDLTRATSTAMLALRELGQLLTASRALTKPAAKARIALGELLTKGSERSGVMLRVAPPEVLLEVGMPLALQGMALALDVAAGVGRQRELEVRGELDGERVTLAMPHPANPAANAGTLLAIATWIFARDGGELRRDGDRIELVLPIVK
jgi:hypothetical protein